MKNPIHHDQALLARESLVKRVELAGYMLLTNVPMAMSGLTDQVRVAYAAITVGAAVACRHWRRSMGGAGQA